MSLPLLSILIWLPIAGAIVVVLLGSGERANLGKVVALATSVLTFMVSILLYTGFDVTTADMQFVENVPWIRRFEAFYYLGIDGISMPLILLTTFLTPIVVIAGWQVIKVRPAQYFAAFLIMEGLMIGVFAAVDALLFYVFWEAMLVPMFIIIGVWGGERRVYATVKFFLYTFLGSVFMLVALIYLYVQAGTYSILAFHDLPLGMTEQMLIFLAFLLAFAVKVPMFPVHTWLPDAHVEAPTGGSVILAAILLKMGGYGFIRFSLPIAPDASQSLAWLMMALSLIAIVYISFVALAQRDMKKLIAYSSIAHMGFVTLGFFVVFAAMANAPGTDGARLALQGGMVQMISHGLISGAMFLCVGVMYDRLHSREIAAYGGVANTMPKFAALMVLFALANAGLPGTSGFVGEFLVILGSFHASFWLAFIAGTTLILGAAYTLWMVKRVLYGEVANAGVASLTDVDAREFWMLMILAIAVLLVGVWPAPLIEAMDQTLGQLLIHVVQSKL
ncbi:MAG TPA: NADH-quinone oxidoreductase subunit M [Gammaproteobacteria bacterium]|nr:NADH-quinone oxidoreductase subunit M [Gammaproteobacteria bacterium]